MQSGTEIEINPRELMQHHWDKAVSRDAWSSFEFEEIKVMFHILVILLFKLGVSTDICPAIMFFKVPRTLCMHNNYGVE